MDAISETPKYPVYKVAFRDVTEFTNDQRAWIGLGVNSMIALGPTFIWVNDGSEHLTFAHWPDDNSTRPNPFAPSMNAGRFTRLANGKGLIEFDPVGLHGELDWIAAAAHETGHFLGMGHLVGVPAIMNPNLDEIEFSADLSKTDMVGNIPPTGPTTADFAEFDRVNRA